MTKYLFYISYLGTRFCGTQFQKNMIGVQNVLNNAVAVAFRVPTQVINSATASRTDAGVHALRTAVTIEIDRKIEQNNTAFHLKLQDLVKPGSSTHCGELERAFDPDHVAAAVNQVLKQMDFDVRVLACRIVSDGFCPRRHPVLRTYMYRLAVLKSEFDNDPNRPLFFTDPDAILPVIEKDRCWAVGSNFNPNTFVQAGQLMQGLHNFRSFSCVQPIPAHEAHLPPPSFIRSVKSVEVLQGSPLIDPRYDPLAGCFNYVDVLIHAKSFVFRQIRKMVGFMVHVAKGKAKAEDVLWLFDNPSEESWTKYGAELAPSGGLYLMNVAYNERDYDHPKPYYNYKRPERIKKQPANTNQSEVGENDDQIDDNDDDDISETESETMNSSL